MSILQFVGYLSNIATVQFFYEKQHYKTSDSSNKIDNVATGESKTEDMIFTVLFTN